MILIRNIIILLTIFFICSGYIVHSYDEDKIMIVATIPQLANIAKEIGGSRVKVEVLIPPGIDPHTYELGGREIKLLEKSDVIIMTGPKHLYIEDRIKDLVRERIINAKIIDYENYTVEGLELKYVPGFNKINPHGYFLSHKGMVAIAKTLTKTLESIDPNNKIYYESRLSEFLTKLNMYFNYAREIIDKAMKKSNRKIIVATFSPIPQYLLEDLGVEIKYVLVLDPHQKLDPKSIEKLINMMTNGEIDVFILTDSDIAHEGYKLAKVLSEMKIHYITIPTLTINDSIAIAISTASSIATIIDFSQIGKSYNSKPGNSSHILWFLSMIIIIETSVIIILILRIRSLKYKLR